MQVNYQDKQTLQKELQAGSYLVATISRDGARAYVGLKNHPAYGSHGPLLTSMGASGTIDDYWRYTFDIKQGAIVYFVIPKFSGRTIIPDKKAEDEIFSAHYDCQHLWDILSEQISKDLKVKISSMLDMEDPEGLVAFYRRQMLKGLTKHAKQLRKQGKIEQADIISRYVNKNNQE